jgi:hypothetical protein
VRLQPFGKRDVAGRIGHVGIGRRHDVREPPAPQQRHQILEQFLSDERSPRAGVLDQMREFLGAIHRVDRHDDRIGA